MAEPLKKDEQETKEQKMDRIYSYDPSPDEVKACYSEEFIKKWLG